MVVAQATAEPLHLLTADKALKRYTELVDLV
jgi:PIN domain nuclease of toxin-antitoxin system